jgi:pilus assembly protein TadC
MEFSMSLGVALLVGGVTATLFGVLAAMHVRSLPHQRRLKEILRELEAK